MLVLRRRIDEVVVINPGSPDEIRVMVVEYDKQRGAMRLGFSAPAHIKILRAELLEDYNEDD